MARYEYVIFTQAMEGQLAEFERWYDEVHLGDVLKIPGVVAARRSRVLTLQASKKLQLPSWCSMAVYEMETDDPQQVMAAIYAASETPEMPLSDALNRRGMLEVVAQPVSQRSA